MCVYVYVSHFTFWENKTFEYKPDWTPYPVQIEIVGNKFNLCRCAYVDGHIHIHTYTYVHTYIHMHTYTCINTRA